jgi:hypothetical protein
LDDPDLHPLWRATLGFVTICFAWPKYFAADAGFFNASAAVSPPAAKVPSPMFRVIMFFFFG